MDPAKTRAWRRLDVAPTRSLGEMTLRHYGHAAGANGFYGLYQGMPSGMSKKDGVEKGASAPNAFPAPTKALIPVRNPAYDSHREVRMTIFDNQPGRPRVINAGAPRGVLAIIGLAIVGLIAVILLFNCITRIGTGNVGVLTLFGKVTGERLSEGIHVINPLKTV